MDKKTLSKKILTQINVNPRLHIKQSDELFFFATNRSKQVFRDLCIKVDTHKMVVLIIEQLKSYFKKL